MVYQYKPDDDKYDIIIVRELAGNVTEQLYLKNDIIVKKELVVWSCRRGYLEECSAVTKDIIIVPPIINRTEQIHAVKENAFARISPDAVIFLSTERVTFEKGSLNNVKKAIIMSWVKRSQITDNMVIRGRVLEDVYSHKKE